MMKIEEIVNAFAFEGTLKGVYPFGSGHINRTYTADFDSRQYVLQQVNTYVFKNPAKLMDNVFAVTDYLRARIDEDGGDPERETLHFIPTKTGAHYLETEDGAVWRAYRFVDKSVCYDKAQTPELLKKSGIAFGRFQKLLRDFPAGELAETIAHFHDTPWRYENEFLPAVREASAARRAACAKEIALIQARRNDMDKITKALQSGAIPLRVTHNDTKLNNVLFDETTQEPLAVIDLDTVMPGSALYDFGDAIRYGANLAAEDERELTRIAVNLDYFKAYAEGFLGEAGDALTEEEWTFLPTACRLMTLELAMRFLTDYLRGNVYFKVAYEEHNLIRACAQLALCRDMEEKVNTMNDIIKALK